MEWRTILGLLGKSNWGLEFDSWTWVLYYIILFYYSVVKVLCNILAIDDIDIDIKNEAILTGITMLIGGNYKA